MIMPVLPLPIPPPPPEGTVEVCSCCGRPWIPADDLVVNLLREIERLQARLGESPARPQ